MSRRTQKNVGVIGLGIIGSRVAENLRRRGFHVFVWNRTPRPVPNFVGSRSEVADLCDFIQIFVSDDEALLETIEQMKRSLKPHHVVMAHSTVAPHTMRAAGEIVQRKGAQLLDAPFTGSKIPAEKGELVYYVAGDAAAFQRARPVLEASSKEIVEIGEIGQATTVKIATNMITATTLQVAAEALALVHSSGVSAEKFAAAMRVNAIQSPTLAMKLPKMMAGDFETHFSVKHMLKDVQIASRLARSYGLSLDATAAARDSLRSEADAGRGDLDFCSLVRVFFPEGTIPPESDAEDSSEEQQTLGGLDERAAPAEKPDPVEEPAVVAETAPKVEEPSAPEKSSEEKEEPKPTAEKPPEEVLPPVPSDETDKAAVTEEKKRDEPESQVPDEPAEAAFPEAKADKPDSPEPKGEPEADSPSREREVPQLVAAESVGASVEDKPPQPNGELEARRSFFSRIFGKSGDY